MPEETIATDLIRRGAQESEELLGRVGGMSAGGPFSLQSVPMDAAGASLLTEWESLRRRSETDSPMQDPEWLRGYFDGQTGNLSMHSLYQANQLCGTASFLRRPWPVKCQLGEVPIAEFPMTRLRLLGGTLNFPAEPAAFDMLFRELAEPGQGFDALYFEEVPVDSFLWKYLHESQLIRKRFLLYEPEAPSPRPLLRVEGSFDQYMGKFSSKHRKNLNREIKKLREGALGEMRLVRYESLAEAPEFLEQAIEVSRRTYQWTLHGRGLSDVDLVRKRLMFAAEHGWMRSYLLFCGGRARAFMLGFQYGDRFLLHEMGFDPDLAKHSVGTVAQMLTIEDLFTHNRPRVFDLQDYGPYKEMLSTESYLQGKVFLFLPGVYARLVRTCHRGCEFATSVLTAAVDRLELKSKIKRYIRGWNSKQ